MATATNPLVPGGATFIVEWLASALESRGHRVNLVKIPFHDEPDTLLEQMMGVRMLDLSRYGELLITIRTPSHLLRHPKKRCWFIHHFRSAYDLWGTKYQTIPHSLAGSALRNAIVSADTAGLREAEHVFCNSAVVQTRLKRYNGIESTVLYPPLPPSEFHGEVTYGDYLLYFCRLAHHKRQWLAIEGLRHTKTQLKLVIAGSPDPDSEPYINELRLLIGRYGLQDRVTLLTHWIDDAQKSDLFSRCRAVAYFPFDEDSYGYPSLEAHLYRKAVLTTSDSGGTVELVVTGRNGVVTPPDPQLIGEAMDRLFANQAEAQSLGEAGVSRMAELGIDWDAVVHRLIS
ncbi:MAG: glycosyltransferase family 4 protein [Bryobacteraceae bacterium]